LVNGWIKGQRDEGAYAFAKPVGGRLGATENISGRIRRREQQGAHRKPGTLLRRHWWSPVRLRLERLDKGRRSSGT